MKKVLCFVVVVMLLSFGTAFAATGDNGTAGGRLILDGETTLEISSSPGVFMYYGDDGTTDPQWYVIGTVHQGGTRFYGTAQNSTNIFYQEAIGPKVLADLTGLTWPTSVADTASETWWSNSGWTR